MSPDIKRHTAHLVTIQDILKGKHIQIDGKPSFIYSEEKKLKLHRVNIVGVVISKNISNFEEIAVDDSSGTILVRNFDETLSLSDVEVGDIVNIIGRPREYNNARYIIPEILKKTTKEMLELRQLEIAVTKPKGEVLNIEKSIAQPEQEQLDENSPKQVVYELIKERDSGNGVGIIELQKKTGLSNIDKIINRLIEEGEIFKIAPDRVKAL